MLTEARRRSRGSSLPVTFASGGALALPFAQGSFDRFRLQSLLLHVSDVAAAVAEIARVARPGGLVGGHVPVRGPGRGRQVHPGLR